MSFDWEELKQDKELLQELVDEFGIRGLARKVNKHHTTVMYHLEKNDNSNAEEKEAAEDERLKIQEFDDGTYKIKHPSKGTFLTSDEELNELRFYYCQLGLTQDETTNKLKKIFGKDKFNYDKFKILKRAFHIVHNSQPLQQRTIDNGDNRELAKQVLDREEKEFDSVFREERIKKLERENKKLRKKRYISNRVINKLEPQVRQMRYEPPRFNIKPATERPCDYLVLLVDWHLGKKVIAEKILGDIEGYNQEIFMSRLNKYLEDVIYGIKQDKPGKIYVADLGDTADGRKIYDKQSQNQDLYGYKQCAVAADAAEYFLKAIHDYNPNMEYLRVPGNHQKHDDSDLLIGELIKRGMRKYHSDIKFDVSDKEYKSREIKGINHIFTHGNNIRTGTYTRKSDVLSIIQLLEMYDKYTYVHQGHLHHLAKEGARHNHWLWPSIVGGDWLGNNAMNEGARASQIFLKLTDEGIKDTKHVHFD